MLVSWAALCAVLSTGGREAMSRPLWARPCILVMAVLLPRPTACSVTIPDRSCYRTLGSVCRQGALGGAQLLDSMS
jgi:hypothetical protein